VGCAVMVERFIDPYRAAFSRELRWSPPSALVSTRLDAAGGGR
jgi:hypothetical protein